MIFFVYDDMVYFQSFTVRAWKVGEGLGYHHQEALKQAILVCRDNNNTSRQERGIKMGGGERNGSSAEQNWQT